MLVIFCVLKSESCSVMSDSLQPYGLSVQFSRSVVSNSLRPHESQHTRPPCPSPTPGVHPDSHPSSQWCHPAISSLCSTRKQASAEHQLPGPEWTWLSRGPRLQEVGRPLNRLILLQQEDLRPAPEKSLANFLTVWVVNSSSWWKFRKKIVAINTLWAEVYNSLDNLSAC